MFCTRCGRKLEEGEVCNCAFQSTPQDTGEPYHQQGETTQGSYGQQGQPNGQNPYWQQGQPNGQNPYGQQGQPNGQNPYGQQGQPNGQNPYGQQGQPNGQNPYGQQGQPNGQNPYGQQGQPNGQNPYWQQGQSGGQNPYWQQGQPNGQNSYGRQGYYGQQPNMGRTREAEWLNNQKDRFVSATRGMLGEILPVMKRPVGRVREIAASGSSAVGLEFLIAKMIISMLITLFLLLRLKAYALDQMGVLSSYASDYIKIPYIQILLVVAVFTMGVDCLNVLFLKVFTGVFNGNTTMSAMFTVAGAASMYISFAVIVSGLLMLLSITLAPVAVFILSFTCMLGTYIEYGGYQACIQLNEDRVSYAFLVAKIVLAIVTAIIAGLFATSIISSVVSTFKNLM